jgi:hypothetical protein
LFVGQGEEAPGNQSPDQSNEDKKKKTSVDMNLEVAPTVGYIPHGGSKEETHQHQ